MSAITRTNKAMKRFLCLIFLLVSAPLLAQQLPPGFDATAAATEYAKALAAKKAPEPAPKIVEPVVPPPELRPPTDVFGARLFTGSFANRGPVQFNSDYAIAIGDQVQVRLWGGFDYEASLTVDPQGNIFLPNLGPVKVQGVRNADLQRVVESAVRKVFRANVQCYANLAAAQAVRVFVGGFVLRPGLYQGTSMDSLLHYLDQAGGIDPEHGSFLNVQIKRGGQVRAEVNLYDFLLNGRLQLIQFADGDVVFVSPRKNTVRVTGIAGNANRFEFVGEQISLVELSQLARPGAQATHVRVTRNSGPMRNIEYYPLGQAAEIQLRNGDDIEYSADKKPGTITVRVEGEHQSPQEYVLPYGARLGELMQRIQPTEQADMASLQLYRQSVKVRQKAMLETSLRSLEAAALTARSATGAEASLRKQEAELLLQWVERARKIEPNGQVQIAKAASRDSLTLENGDVLRIPSNDGLVLVSGEVLFPNAIAFDPGLSTAAYIQRAGGYTQNADTSRVIVAHRDGSFSEGSASGWLSSSNPNVEMRPGDEVLVLPRIDVKTREFAKDVMQIVYQIAIATSVVLGL
ncbi:polysaccharide biosynthesis/export family protein [Niveibacterium sp. SC-1]|uniref:polysaccharide biosynthesis/export family protein n=1 Tax=Niveibacterium sp. SC-1 TaxID=3135646 RepID=UPI00311DB050